MTPASPDREPHTEMNELRIEEVDGRRERRAWVEFAYDHYRGHPHHVPPLLKDELDHFDPRKNPAFDVNRVRFFVARRGGEIVGRVCGIVHDAEAARVGHRRGRFGWFETIDDRGVAHALLDRVREWLVSEGCQEMVGPLGFTDLDPGGLLVEGHDQIPTVAGSYHHPWYREHLESWGLEKQVDYLEFRLDVSEPVPLLERLRERAEVDEGEYRLVNPPSRKALLALADAFWKLLDETYAHLYGVVPLTEAQTRYYTDRYLSYLDPDFVQLVFDAEEELVGMLVGMPNLSRAFRSAAGRLLPFGFWHVLRAYRKPEAVDLLLTGARPDIPSGRLTAQALLGLCDTLRARGIRYLEVNRQLETNTAVNRLWRRFDIVATRRTRIYRRDLG